MQTIEPETIISVSEEHLTEKPCETQHGSSDLGPEALKYVCTETSVGEDLMACVNGHTVTILRCQEHIGGNRGYRRIVCRTCANDAWLIVSRYYSK